MHKIKVKETLWGPVHVPLLCSVGRMHCRDRGLDDTCQTAAKMVNQNDSGVSDCKNRMHERKSSGRT